MSKSLNLVAFTGYLGGDPRCHTFDDGGRVANLSLAVARQKKENGEFVDDTIWVDVKVSARAGSTGSVDAIEKYLARGSFVAVSGQLAQPREWEDRDGNPRFTIVVDYANVTFGPRTDGGNGGNGGSQQQAQPAQQQRAAAPVQSKLADDTDIPF
jgi:single-strand DNA-binding protein